MKYTCSMETVQQNGRFTLFSSKFLSIYSILYVFIRSRSMDLIPEGTTFIKEFKENWIQGGGNRVSVHFPVTFLDCWRTSFFVITMIKIVNNNTNDKQTFGASLALDEDSPYTNSCLFTLDRLPLLLLLRHSKVYGNFIAPSLYSIILGLDIPCTFCTRYHDRVNWYYSMTS